MDATMGLDEYHQWRNGRLVDPDATVEERNRGMLAHVLGMLGLLDHFLFGLVGTVVLYAITKGRSAFADDHAREAINFQLSLLIYEFAGGMLVLFTLGLGALVVVPALFALWILRLVTGIQASMAATRGEHYRYPMCMRFLA